MPLPEGSAEAVYLEKLVKEHGNLEPTKAYRRLRTDWLRVRSWVFSASPIEHMSAEAHTGRSGSGEHFIMREPQLGKFQERLILVLYKVWSARAGAGRELFDTKRGEMIALWKEWTAAMAECLLQPVLF